MVTVIYIVTDLFVKKIHNISTIGLLTFILTLFCMKQQNDYTLL